MQTLHPTDTSQVTSRPRRSGLLAAIAIAAVVVVGAVIAIWAVTGDDGPTAAEDARIELTFSGDDATYAGDREIVEGRADVMLVNDASRPIWFVVQYFEPGSTAIDLDRYPEGTDFVSDGGPAGDPAVMEQIDPGSVTRSIVLRPGTYIVEAAEPGEDATHVWRAAVIDVVSD